MKVTGEDQRYNLLCGWDSVEYPPQLEGVYLVYIEKDIIIPYKLAYYDGEDWMPLDHSFEVEDIIFWARVPHQPRFTR
jgi:hypothetical protein